MSAVPVSRCMGFRVACPAFTSVWCRCRNFLHAAVEAQHPDALFDMADTFARGAEGLAPNPEVAMTLFMQAAAQVSCTTNVHGTPPTPRVM